MTTEKRRFEAPDRNLWRQAAARLCKEFKITIRQLYKILEFTYGFQNSRDYDRYLDLPLQEVKKAIRRVKPKLKKLTQINEERKMFPDYEKDVEDIFTADQQRHNDCGAHKCPDGVWRQGFNLASEALADLFVEDSIDEKPITTKKNKT
jgi:hypothetical protein